MTMHVDSDMSMGECHHVLSVSSPHRPGSSASAPGDAHHCQSSTLLSPNPPNSSLSPLSAFQALPLELLAKVLSLLPDLPTVHHAIQTCRRARDAYAQFHTQITVRAIFTRRLAAVWGYHHAGAAYVDLDYAVRHCRAGRHGAGFVARADARAMLAMAWPVFRKRRIDELLAGPAVVLARCLWAADGGEEGHRSAALELLRGVWCGEAPFGDHPSREANSSSRRRRGSGDGGGDGGGEDVLLRVLRGGGARRPRWEPTFVPVGRALADMLLGPAEGADAGEEARAARNAVLAAVRRLAASVPGLEHTVHTAEVRDGKIVLRPPRAVARHAGESSCASSTTIGVVYNAPRRPFDEFRKVVRPRGTIVWRYDPGEVPYPLIDEARPSPFQR